MSLFKLSDRFLGIASHKEKNQDGFFGREDKIKEAIKKLIDHRIVVLSGASGSGKTSMLLAGVVPTLRRRRLGKTASTSGVSIGFPIVLREWGKFRVSGVYQHDLTGFAEFIIDAIKRYAGQQIDDRQGKADERSGDDLASLLKHCEAGTIRLPPEMLSAFRTDIERFEIATAEADGEASGDGVDRLEEFVGNLAARCGGVTLVFDQLEELLRIDPKFIGTVNTTIYRLRTIKGVRIVLSLREEYLSALRQFELRGGGLDQTHVYVQKLTLEAAIEVFTRLCVDISEQPGASKVELSPELIVRLERKFSSDENVPQSRTTAEDSSDQPTVELMYLSGVLRQLVRRLEVDQTEKYELNSASLDRAFRGADPIMLALRSIFDDCFVRDSENSRTFKRFVAGKIASSMSSGGYKLSQKQSHLFKEVFGDRIKFLQNEEVESACKRLVWAKEKPVEPTSKELERTVKSEFEACMDALEREEILKRYATAGTDHLWELTHDRLGDPFVRWADDQRHTLLDCLADPLGSRGVSPMRVSGGGATGGGRAAPLTNLSWLGCYIEPVRDDSGVSRARLTGFVFKNCEFSGTVFDSLAFEDCEFDECRFNGSLFNRCTFKRTQFKNIGRDKERPGGFTVGFLGCSFKEGTSFENCKFVQPAFGRPKIESDVEFRGVEIHLGSFEGANENGGKFKFDGKSEIIWSRWDLAFDGRITPETIMNRSALFRGTT